MISNKNSYNITCKRFEDCELEEHMMIIKWRNHPKVKEFMHTRHTITLEEHLMFLDNIKTAANKHYFLAMSGNDYIGVVSLNGDQLGIYANPEYSGMGDLLLEWLLGFGFYELGLSTIKAQVYAHNHKAIKLYKRFDFEIVSSNEQLITMQRKK